MILRYDDSPFCSAPDPSEAAKNQQKFCGHMGPAALDLAASFGLLGPVEPFASVRLGFVGESATDTRPLVALGVGTRIYTRSRAALKVFVEPSLALELEGGRGNPRWADYQGFEPVYKDDLIFRAAVGPQWDVSRRLGLYAQVFGLSVGILRSLNATLEFGAGVQARFP
jgi:hypothetical protein